MKLVEILARELDKWRGGAECATQEMDSRTVYFWKSPEVSNHGGEWFHDTGMGLLYHDWSLRSESIATDHATAIVTREMWQAERERIAKPGKKANADGWIRHRGGKCPVDDGVIVEVRLRDGTAWTGEEAESGDFWHWRHGGGSGDIMAYRIHKPAEQPFDPEKAEKDAVEAGAVITVEADIDFPSGVIHIDGPLAWRDRIREIDSTVEALEEERVSLIQRLEGEGLQLIREQPVDMSDCLKWKRGDKVMANDDSAGGGGGFHKGGIYVMREDCTNKDHSIKVVADDNGVENGWGSKFFTFHSRPSA